MPRRRSARRRLPDLRRGHPRYRGGGARLQGAVRIRPAQRGYVRRAGYYGRFTGTRPEMKFHDIVADDTVILGAGEVQTALLKIPEGNGEEQRVGRKIIIKKIAFRFDINLAGTASQNDTADIVRVIMVLDKQCNGALPNVTDVLKSADWLSYNLLANSMRFSILMDRTYAINHTAGSGRGVTDNLSYGLTFIHDSFYKNCDIRIEYSSAATDGNIATIKSNNIFLLYISRKGLAGIDATLRFRFND